MWSRSRRRPARCAWIEAITGQFYLAVIVAGLVSMLVAKDGQPKVSNSANEQGDSGIEATR